MFGAVSDRRCEGNRDKPGSSFAESKLALEWVECSDAVSSVCELNGLEPDALCSTLFLLESELKSRTLLATNEAGLEWLGVVFLLDIRLSSGLGLAGVGIGARGSLFELVLAILHGRSLRRSGERWFPCSSSLSPILPLPMPKPPMLALLRCLKDVPFCGGRSIESMLS
jgi:hypothetical protein